MKKKNNPSYAPTSSRQSSSVFATSQQTHIRKGPLPDATQMEHYEKVLPGAAERILRMAEMQSEHRRAIEKTVINAGVRNSLLGVIFAFILGLITLSAGLFIVYTGHIATGSLLSGTGLAGLAGMFIYGTKSQRLERIQRNKEDKN